MENEAVLHAIGLCARARKLVAGTPQVCLALAGAKKPYLVAEASGNSANTAKRLRDKCAYYGVTRVTIGADGAELAHAIGKSGTVAAVAITDENLCRLVLGAMEKEHN